MRTYLVHLPASYSKDKAWPVVLVFHGGGGNGEQMAGMTGFSRKADREGFIAVYPNGSGRWQNRFLTWNAGNCCAYAYENGIDDVGFIRALIGKLKKDYAVDERRVFATGISNGGMMSYRLACGLSDLIAAIGPVAGAQNIDCEPKRPVSVVILHGTADLYVRYKGGTPLRMVDVLQPEGRPSRLGGRGLLGEAEPLRGISREGKERQGDRRKLQGLRGGHGRDPLHPPGRGTHLARRHEVGLLGR